MTDTIDMLFKNARLSDGGTYDIAVADGRIRSIADKGSDAEAGCVIDIAAELLVPGFVEGHIHLDTSFYGDAWIAHKPCSNGFDVHERVAFQAQNMAIAAPMDERARKQLDLCIANGALLMRSHVMVDASVGLKSLETILKVREEYLDLIDIQLVAFPQGGILKSPGTAELLDEAIVLGADLVGGLDPLSFDRDIKGHLDVVFGIAERRGVDVDIHLHDPGTLGSFTIEEICARTTALGMQGRVAISHAYGLGDLSPEAAGKSAGLLARSGVSIMTNAPGSHNFPPVALLRSEGVVVFSGSDNIRDSWWPYGDGDMLRRAEIIGYRSGFYTDAELDAAFDVVTSGGAKALNVEGYGIEVGARADFVTLAASHVPEAVVSVPKGRRVFKAGRLVAENGAIINRR
ncbi:MULTISPECIES: amidohydrolase family protein [unclassified Rhizobium]|uniref:amidohydrolase family protein n=1 Tax=unclassified Rhizobium TaxID=2613769 RepID=UPI00161934D6|nr:MULTISPECIES: amidohydrolase family protein [unclassified Rhizobium]MBB3317997.1 cytosine deaminase [Rhizobium sp. BK181]MCS3742885.1 cytosine deaminase [Rhizobium sp. BK661]MCS4095101.1 cytosine deaminase [Rhizobium sp. BK176]